MNPLVIQRLIAVPFLGLGAWCLFFPGTVERLGFRPEFYVGNATSAVLVGCFGAQAILAGLFAALSRFTRTTFLAYGLALLPFFGFNYWFVFVVPMFNVWMLLDFVANAAMLALCILGWRATSGAGRVEDPSAPASTASGTPSCRISNARPNPPTMRASTRLRSTRS